MEYTIYAGWRVCIEVHCGIPLTPAFIAERLAELRQRWHPSTRRFVELYGEEHLACTIGWFERAEAELTGG